MNRVTTICIAATGLWACAPAFGGRQAAPCTVECTLELTNGTTLDLDIQVTQRAIGAVVHEHLGPGETRRILLGSSEIPVVAVQGAQSAWMTRPLTVSVRCAVPTRSGDSFRSACRLASVSAVPGDSAHPGPASGPVR